VTPATPGGRRYFLLLIDDLSRYMWVVVLGSKIEAANAIKRAQAVAEVECGRKLRVLRIDNGSEFTAAEFTSYCADEGIQRHYSASYNPQQNGVVKRRNQTVVGMARALLKQRGMHAIFWGEAVVTAVRGLAWAQAGGLSHMGLRLPRIRQGAWPHRQARRQEHSGGVHRLHGGLEGLPQS
jgi:transposase InsO family protein